MRNTVIIIIIGVLLLLAVTNPGLNEFNSWIEQEINQQIQEKAEDDPLFSLVTALGLEKYVANYIMPDVEHRDYLFFSVYEFETPGEEGKQTRILGIANRFIKL